MGKRADRQTHADVQPDSEGPLARKRLRGKAFRPLRKYFRRRETPCTASRAKGPSSKNRCLPPRRACSSRATGSLWKRRFPTGETRSCCFGACRPVGRASIRWPNITRPTAISAGGRSYPPGLAYVNGRTLDGSFKDVYEHSALRVRERGLDDFEFYTRNIDPQTRAKWWRTAQKDPRFKSTEDAAMQFGAAALTEQGLRLWQSDFLPAVDRKSGFAAFMQAMFEPSYPPTELKKGANSSSRTAPMTRRCRPGPWTRTAKSWSPTRRNIGSDASKGCTIICSPRTAASKLSAAHGCATSIRAILIETGR